jgi:release factor glutamine methyltransferase
MSRTIQDLLRWGKKYLQSANKQQGALDAELLLMHVLSLSRVQLLTCGKDVVEKKDEKQYQELIEKRVNGKPTQYLIHQQEFMSLPFYVDEHVLIPRSDTEILVETAIEFIQNEQAQLMIDIGTGSGCISVSLAHYCPHLSVIAVDISAEALAVARKNAQINKVENRIQWMKSDLFTLIPTEYIGKLDAIISNPPYIPRIDIDTLMEEVKDYEPIGALDGGEDGLDFYRKIILTGKAYLKTGGKIFFEIGYDQGEAVSELLRKDHFTDVCIEKDLAGLNRVVSGRKI